MGDLISRQAAIDALEKVASFFPDEKTYMPGDYFCGSAERKEEAE